MKDIKNLKMVFFAFVAIVGIIIVFGFFRNILHLDNENEDSELRAFLSDSDFLHSSNKAIESYRQAVSMFESLGFNKENFKVHLSSGPLERACPCHSCRLDGHSFYS